MTNKDNKQWYSNKDLFEKLNDMRIEFRDLSNEMQQTRKIIKKYNGLYEKIEDVEIEIDNVDKKIVKVDNKISDIERVTEGKNKVKTAIHQWGGWLFSFITLMVLLYTTFN